MNRQQLAEASGVPDGTLAGLLAGTKPMYVDQIVGLALALDIEPAAWMEELGLTWHQNSGKAADVVSIASKKTSPDSGISSDAIAADDDVSIAGEQESRHET